MTPSPNTGISAVIPAFNNADTIVEALESVAAQTHPVAEVVVVDDGSADKTAEAARACMERCALPGVVLGQRNAGPASARNRGVDATSTEWIAFLDGDDVWFPSRLRTQLALAEKHGDVDCWCGRAVRWGEPELPDTLSPPVSIPTFRLVSLDDLLINNAVATSTVLVKRQSLLAAGGFDPAFRGPEDFDLWLRLAARARVAFVETPLARYRYQPGSLSMDERRFLPEVIRVLDKAFGPGGVLESRQADRSLAESTQYWNASWMAFVRGDRRAAVGLWWRAWRLNRVGPQRTERPWWRLLARYAVGSKAKG